MNDYRRFGITCPSHLQGSSILGLLEPGSILWWCDILLKYWTELSVLIARFLFNGLGFYFFNSQLYICYVMPVLQNTILNFNIIFSSLIMWETVGNLLSFSVNFNVLPADKICTTWIRYNVWRIRMSCMVYACIRVINLYYSDGLRSIKIYAGSLCCQWDKSWELHYVWIFYSVTG